MILAKRKIHTTEITIDTTNIEAVGVQLNKNLTIVAAYLRPQDDLLQSDLDKIFNTSKQVLLMGDLNARHTDWSCSRSNAKGRMLNAYIDNLAYVLLAPDSHTHFPYNYDQLPSTIDIALLKNITNCSSLEAMNELDSDHLPIILTLQNESEVLENDSKFFNYAQANWQVFRDNIENNLEIDTKIHSTNVIDQAVEKLTNAITHAMHEAIPLMSHSPKPERLDPETRELIRQRNRLRKKAQDTGDTDAKIEKNKLSRIIKTRTEKHMNERWDKKLSKLTPKDNSLWRLSKYFTKSKDHKIPPLHGPNGVVFSNDEKAEVLSENFERVHHLRV